MSSARYQDPGYGITLIDTGYHRAEYAASYLIEDDGVAAFVETGATPGVPSLLAELDRRNVSREAVAYVIVSHVHLDHAGGAGVLLSHLPNAHLVVHTLGAPHLIDPSRLSASALEVYGEVAFRQSFQEIRPIPETRVIKGHDGLQLPLGSRTLTLYDTPGHARHHICVWDDKSRGLFSGDAFGIAYRELDNDGQPLIFPATTPTQFDPETMRRSIDRLASLQPRTVFLTHYGPLPFSPYLSETLHQLLDAYVTVAQRHATDGQARHGHLVAGIEKTLLDFLARSPCSLPLATRRELLAMDVEINAQGLANWLDRELRAQQITPSAHQPGRR
ncbi:MAG: MBL fold metallo-hydrolase [Magnetococcales bacterium]|nr:MBL fold metallo-hydrolase [Magnetococcales bacterium]